MDCSYIALTRMQCVLCVEAIHLGPRCAAGVPHLAPGPTSHPHVWTRIYDICCIFPFSCSARLPKGLGGRAQGCHAAALLRPLMCADAGNTWMYV